MKRLYWAALFSCVAVTAFAQAPAVSRYYIYDVGQIVGNLTFFHLNENGAMIWNSNGHAYVYQSCTSRDLGNLGGGQSIARSINNNGVVVGKSLQPGGRWRAFSHYNNTMHDLGGSTNPQIFEEATAVNFWGDTVGVESLLGTLAPTGVRYTNGGNSPLARFLVQPQNVWAFPNDVTDINDSSYVTSFIRSGSGAIGLLSTNFGYMWSQIVGVPGLEFATFPFALNRYGHIAGIAGNGFTRAFLSRNSAAPATDLGTLGGSLSGASGINNYDWVVGWAEVTNGGGPRAFLHDGTHMIDLNSDLWNGAGWTLFEAMDVNDAGQIVGQGSFNGQLHAFFLQPMKRPPIFNPCGVIVIQP